MAALLSADDLNDFISPSVACIKPVETLPTTSLSNNPYEVTTEDAALAANPPPAQISLTDCLACSGCVTSAEAMLVSLQSYQEVMTMLDTYKGIDLSSRSNQSLSEDHTNSKLFIATISPQARASIAAAFGVTEREAGSMIHNFLVDQTGIKSKSQNNTGFFDTYDSNTFRELALVAAADEVHANEHTSSPATTGDYTQRNAIPMKPILTSACPGWICYAEKTHPHVLPHVSKVKSPQAIAGTFLKSILSKRHGLDPSQIWHMAVMPCFDKKLEASREELTDIHWSKIFDRNNEKGVRDVDLVITPRELLLLADAKGFDFASLSGAIHTKPLGIDLNGDDSIMNDFLSRRRHRKAHGDVDAGTSGGFLYHILRTEQLRNPGSKLAIKRGRNADVVEYTVSSTVSTATSTTTEEQILLRAARYYGFRNIQNLVRRLKPAKQSRMPGASKSAEMSTNKSKHNAVNGANQGVSHYDYVEVMACPGGCTNGGGQIKVDDEVVISSNKGGMTQKEWLGRVDEAYFSGDEGECQDSKVREKVASYDNGDEVVDGLNVVQIKKIIKHWTDFTGLDKEALLYTTYRKVESDVGKKSTTDVERVAGLASTIGGW